MSPSVAARSAAAARATPDDRNRAVDLLRVAALVVVVLGHWVMQGLYVDGDGVLNRRGLLGLAPWTHPFTWLLQVMPIFFLVGGYVNALSWRRARQRGASYGAWLAARLARLTRPLLPLLVLWAVLAPTAGLVGLDGPWLRIASHAALVPTWFLATYVLVVALVPWTLAWWERSGLVTLLVLVLLAGLVDVVTLALDDERLTLALGLVNVLLVWGGVHQAGYAWVDGALPGRGWPLLLSAVAFGLLLALVVWGPYAVSMVGVDGHGVDNTYPPRVTLLLLGLGQAGLAVALAPTLDRLLRGSRLWLVTVVVSARVMTIYLWHLTVLALAVGVALLAGGAGLGPSPASSAWWWTRPAWFAVLGVLTWLVVLAVGRFEDPPPTSPRADVGPGPALLEVVVTAAVLAALADHVLLGAGGAVRWWLPLLPVVVTLAVTRAVR